MLPGGSIAHTIAVIQRSGFPGRVGFFEEIAIAAVAVTGDVANLAVGVTLEHVPISFSSIALPT